MGVYKSLFENGIRPDVIYGCSVGSLVGALIADGKKPDELIAQGLSVGVWDIFDLDVSLHSLIGGNKLNRFLRTNLKSRRFEELQTSLQVVATDTRTGTGKYFNSGDVADAVQASCSIPRVFKPKLIDGVEYLDGDLVSPVPIKQAREDHGGNAVIVGVDIIASLAELPRKHRSWARWVEKDTYRKRIVSFELPFADLMIAPSIGYGKYFDRASRLMRIEKGYSEMQAKIPDLRRILGTV